MSVGRLIRFAVFPSLLALVAVGSSVAPAFADLSGTAVYEIEAKEQYCADATTQCIRPNRPPDLASLRFALVELYRLSSSGTNVEVTRHASNAVPDAVLVKCAGPHSMDGRGNIHSTTMFAFVGPSGQGLDAGTITGSVSLSHGLEGDTASTSVVALEGQDSLTGDSFVITGQQVANNVSDTLVGGGFMVSLSGPQFDEIVAGPDANESAPPNPTGNKGTMTCSTGNPSVSTPGAPRAYWENEVLDTLDPDS
jgi:hypothetical protein